MKHQQTQTTSTVPKKNITQYIYIYISFFILFKQEKMMLATKGVAKTLKATPSNPKKTPKSSIPTSKTQRFSPPLGDPKGPKVSPFRQHELIGLT